MTSDGSKYECEWKDDFQQGHGIEKFSNGNTYVGEYKEGMKHGNGKQYLSFDGSVYDG